MFDVVWANPERELVGQRKARKEKEKEKKQACSSGSRSIASAETELSVRSRKPQSFMESLRLRKKKKAITQQPMPVPMPIPTPIPIPAQTPIPTPMHTATGSSSRHHQDTFSASDLRTPTTIVRSPSTSWHTTEPWSSGGLPAPRVVGTKASTRSSSGTISEETRASTATSHDDVFASLSASLLKLQKHMMEMSAADHQTYLQRLTEEWGAWTDAALYKEMEMEKKRWMVSALYSVSPAPKTEIVKLASAERRIMTFFDTQATTSYIAAVNPGVPVHHMGPIPLSSRSFPNVSPMQANAASKKSFTTTPPVFSDIYSLSLPVLVSASDLPAVLHNMHRVLKPQGILHLFLIDPSPARSVTGPRLQAWLDENLLLNLERLFRCTSPTRLFYNWLRDAHFQVAKEAKVVCKFEAAQPKIDTEAEAEAEGEAKAEAKEPKDKQKEVERYDKPMTSNTATFDEYDERRDSATPTPYRRTEWSEGTRLRADTGPAEEPARPSASTSNTTASTTTRQLQTVVGQKIWQEVWGPYVTADRWWWEDEACREECIRMGTVWEYHIVDAVKKERYVAA